MPKVGEAGKPVFTQINDLLAGCETLLDVGAGIGASLAIMQVPVKLGLEIHRPYLENWPKMPGVAVPLNLPARSLSRVFLPGTVDAVTFIDSLEHLRDDEARQVLRRAEEIARRIVLVFTPRGVFAQQDYDAWGLGGECYQKHRSAWEPESFTEMGYDVLIYTGFHDERNEAFRKAFPEGSPPVDALLAYKKKCAPGDGERSTAGP